MFASAARGVGIVSKLRQSFYVHRGTKRQHKRILGDLRRRKSDWLRLAAKQMAKALESDWNKYRE
jgi:DNA-binding FadR family transcriptional regulator